MGGRGPAASSNSAAAGPVPDWPIVLSTPRGMEEEEEEPPPMTRASGNTSVHPNTAEKEGEEEEEEEEEEEGGKEEDGQKAKEKRSPMLTKTTGSKGALTSNSRASGAHAQKHKRKSSN